MNKDDLTSEVKFATREAANFLGISTPYLKKLRLTGAGPAYYRLGRRVVYSLDTLQAWLDDHRVTQYPSGGVQ